MSTSTISTIGACPVELRTERPARPPQMRQASVDDYGQIAALQRLAPYLALAPGIAIALAVLGLNMLGDGLRDYIDPRRRL